MACDIFASLCVKHYIYGACLPSSGVGRRRSSARFNVMFHEEIGVLLMGSAEHCTLTGLRLGSVTLWARVDQ